MIQVLHRHMLQQIHAEDWKWTFVQRIWSHSQKDPQVSRKVLRERLKTARSCNCSSVSPGLAIETVSVDLCRDLFRFTLTSISSLNAGMILYWYLMLYSSAERRRKIFALATEWLISLPLTRLSAAHAATGRPALEAELDRQCVALKKADVCVKNYSRNCATGLQRQMINLWFNGPANLHREYCTKGSQTREKYIENAPCLRKSFNDGKQTCMKDMKVAFEFVTTVKWDKRQPLTCCAYNRALDCQTKLTKKECGTDSVTFVKDLLRTALSRMPEIMCHDYTSKTRICRDLPPPGTESRGGPTTSALNKFLTSYIGVV